MVLRRNTLLRQNLISFFENSCAPKTAKELLFLFQEKQIEIEKSSLYRQLEKLVEDDILEMSLDLSGQRQFELKNSHHHHFICQSCETQLELTDSKLEKEIFSLSQKIQRQGYSVRTHQFNLIGLCQNCTL